MAHVITAQRVLDGTQHGSGSGVPATATALARSVAVNDSTPVEPDVVGWLRTTSNTGLASMGLSSADMSPYGTVPTFGGASPNITGTHTRQHFDLGNGILAPGDNTVFNECLIEGEYSLVQLMGTGVEFNNCDFLIQGGDGMSEAVHINGHPYYAGAGASVTISRCLMRGGTIFINLTSVGGLVEYCYGFDQDPEVGGEQHRDGFTSRGASLANPITLYRSRFACEQTATTGALFLQDTYGDGVVGITIEDCMFEGTGYTMALEGAQDLVFINNRSHPFSTENGGTFGPITSSGTTFATWTDMYEWDSTPPDYAGAVIPQPT